MGTGSARRICYFASPARSRTFWGEDLNLGMRKIAPPNEFPRDCLGYDLHGTTHNSFFSFCDWPIRVVDSNFSRAFLETYFRTTAPVLVHEEADEWEAPLIRYSERQSSSTFASLSPVLLLRLLLVPRLSSRSAPTSLPPSSPGSAANLCLIHPVLYNLSSLSRPLVLCIQFPRFNHFRYFLQIAPRCPAYNFFQMRRTQVSDSFLTRIESHPGPRS